MSKIPASLTETSTPLTILNDLLHDLECSIDANNDSIARDQAANRELKIKKGFLEKLIAEAKQAEVRKEIEAEIVARRAAEEIL